MGEPAARVDPAAGAAALDRFFATFYRQRPVTATFTGLHAHDERLPDWSPDGLAQARDDMAAMRTVLHDAGRPADADVRAFPGDVDLALADATLEIAIAEHDSGRFVHSNPTLWTGEAIFGVLSLLTRDFAPLPDRLEHARARMESTPTFLAQARHAVLRAPKRWLAKAVAECGAAETLLREALPAWIAALDRARQLGRVDRRAWLSAADTAAMSFGEFRRWLGEFDAPGWPVPASDPEWGESPARERVGEEMLSLLVRRGHWVTTPLPDLLHEATDAVAHEAARLDTACRPHGGWAAVQERLAADHPPADRWLARFHERWQECRAAAAAHDLVTWPDAPLRYVPYPAHVKDAAPQLYYLHYRSPAPFDPFGTFDYVVPGLDDLTPAQVDARLRQWNESAITLNHVVHHGAIGHHVQNHHAYRGASRLGQVAAVDSACRIAMFPGGSLAEGWACYVCDLMDEIGFLTPLESIAQQHTRLRIAARAVADLTLHLGLSDIAEVTALYEDRARLAPAAARAEAVRNSMYPGAAVMYWLGTRGIHALRAAVARREGPGFSLRRFHDRLLSHGAIPVALIARLMLAGETPQ
jgi:hypothetical protein